MSPRSTITALLMLALAGCATSMQFQRGAAFAGPKIAVMAEQYVNGDTSLTPAVQAQRITQLAALQSAAATAKDVTEPAFEAAFDAVDAWLPTYITGDPNLDAGERADRLLPLVYMQQVIAAEKSRKFGSHGATAQ